MWPNLGYCQETREAEKESARKFGEPVNYITKP